MLGNHLVRSWSKTQAGIALSSAEAELAGVVRTTAEVIGFAGMMKDLGRTLTGKGYVYADASAALGIIQRKGVGSIRHLDTRLLWIQEKAVKEVVEFKEVAGTVNPADLERSTSKESPFKDT